MGLVRPLYSKPFFLEGPYAIDVVCSCSKPFFGKVKWESSSGYEKIPEIFYATAYCSLLYYFHQLTMIREVFGAVKSRKIERRKVAT